MPMEVYVTIDPIHPELVSCPKVHHYYVPKLYQNNGLLDSSCLTYGCFQDGVPSAILFDCVVLILFLRLPSAFRVPRLHFQNVQIDKHGPRLCWQSVLLITTTVAVGDKRVLHRTDQWLCWTKTMKRNLQSVSVWSIANSIFI